MGVIKFFPPKKPVEMISWIGSSEYINLLGHIWKVMEERFISLPSNLGK